MRILGVDLGSKRTGLSVSDELGILARELEVVPFEKTLTRIKELVEELEVGKVVVGRPLGMSGQDTRKTQETKSFVEKLEKELPVPVETFDERMTTQMALKIQGGDRSTDSLAAQMILQMYLDSKNG